MATVVLAILIIGEGLVIAKLINMTVINRRYKKYMNERIKREEEIC